MPALVRLVRRAGRAAREIARFNTQIARLLDRWDGDGLPTTRSR